MIWSFFCMCFLFLPVCMFVRLHVCMKFCECVFVCRIVCVCVCTHICERVCARACVYGHVQFPTPSSSMLCVLCARVPYVAGTNEGVVRVCVCVCVCVFA